MSWRGLPAPVVPLGEPGVTVTGPAVWGIRFATPEYGFVFGNGLQVTTDGGKHWSATAYPGGSIVSLEIIDGQVLAVTMSRGMAGHESWALLRRPLAGGAWTRLVTQASAIGNIATQARVAAIIDGTSVLVTGNGGLNVIAINGNIKASLVLSGGADDTFIVNVTGSLNLGNKEMLGLSGGLTRAG